MKNPIIVIDNETMKSPPIRIWRKQGKGRAYRPTPTSLRRLCKTIRDRQVYELHLQQPSILVAPYPNGWRAFIA